jgi:phosphopantothenoylcysteine decarboxylase/phosphopantothenate--cysteine ligase
MRCVVTAGPTYEPLDNVRRLTNFSTGRLGSELANYLAAQGHSVTLLLGEHATYRTESCAERVQNFTTTTDLEERLRELGQESVGAVFHAAAVSDFKFGKIWVRSERNELTEVKSGKISTRAGTLLAELVPTTKIIARLRAWFPSARLVGWKFEVEGNRATVIELAKTQILECRTDACVANGPGYGPGFGLVTPDKELVHLPDQDRLFEQLTKLIEKAE